MKKVLVVNGESYYTPFAHIGEYTGNYKLLESDPKSIALVVFTGGEDVTPSYYNEKKQPETYCNPSRDAFEFAIYKKVLENKIPMAGICRGAQFLCAMAGGKLYQHVDNHGGVYHGMKTFDGRLLSVNSTHHQMQIPPEGAKILAWAYPNLNFKDGRTETECAYYPNINALGMQYHPETMRTNSEGFLYSKELASLLMEGKL